MGCGAAAETPVSLEARRGISLVAISFFSTRTLTAPACSRCRKRRRTAGLGAYAVPLLLGAWFLFGVHLVPVGQTDPVKVVCAALMVVALFALQNRGCVWLDHRVYGVSARSLSADGARVRLRVRSEALRKTLTRGARAAPLRAQDADELGIEAG